MGSHGQRAIPAGGETRAGAVTAAPGHRAIPIRGENRARRQDREH
jgi:hypothetical protein